MYLYNVYDKINARGDIIEYYSIGKFSKLICKNAQTLREWDKKGELKPHHITPSGYRYYSKEQLNHFLGLKGVATNTKKVIGYCRVSSNKQKDDLAIQIEQGKRANKAKKMIKELLENDNLDESEIRAE